MIAVHDPDIGARCADHVGELYRPRCAACDEVRQTHLPRIGYFPGTSCPDHHDYPQPCARCERDATDPNERD